MSEELTWAIPRSQRAARRLEIAIAQPGARYSWRRLVLQLFLAIVLLYALATAVRIYARGYYIFLPNYARQAFAAVPAHTTPTHVFFLFVDHFEPDWDVARTERWADRY